MIAINGPKAGRTYFHVHKARPWGLICAAVGMTGLSATWLTAPSWIPLTVLTIIFGGFVILGLPAAVSGGCYRTWFAGGWVHWEYPSRFYGKNDACLLNDIVVFQQVGGDEARSPSVSTPYRFILKDGTTKRISQSCFGDREAFLAALTKANKKILYSQAPE
jgi:hypothetical protein